MLFVILTSMSISEKAVQAYSETAKESDVDANRQNTPLALSLLIMIIVWAPVTLLVYIRGKYTVPHISVLAPLFGALTLLCGIAVTLKFYRRSLKLLTFEKWQIALALLIGLQAIQLLVTRLIPNSDMSIPTALYKAFFFLALIGFAEELWFRGIWFEMFKRRFVPCVLLGSIAFGLIHFPHGGFLTVLLTALVGLIFAAARFRGASILALALAHGTLDFLNGYAFSPDLRFSLATTVAIFIPASLLLAAVLLLVFTPSLPSQQNQPRPLR